MEEDFTESEFEQMRKFSALHKIAKGILLKWLWLLAIVFVVAFGGFSAFFVWHSAKSVHRFSAETKLLYSPRKVHHFENMADRQLMSVLDRRSLKRKVGTLVEMPEAEKECLSIDMQIKQGLKQTSNIFTLEAQSGSWKGAVLKVNAYAEILIAEYVDYRTRDLDAQRETIERRRKMYQEQIAEVESEESVIKGRAGVATPVEMLTTVNMLLSDQRRNLSVLGVQVANEEVRKKRLESEVGKIGPTVIANAPTIRKRSAEINAIDAELAKLRENYTDINPKVMGKLEERKILLDSYAAFLKENGIGNVAVEDIERIEHAALELAVVQSKLDVLVESQRSLNAEIKNNEARSSELTAAVSTLERLRNKREDLERSLKDVMEQLDSLGYLQSSLGSDLRQIERAGGAGDANPLRVKNFIIAGGGAFAVMLVVAFWLLSIEFMFGKVYDSVEVTAWGDVTGLGSLPNSGVMAEADEKDVLGVVALNFCNADVPKGVVLVCRLPGVAEQSKFREVLDWSLAMAGHKPFLLTLVRGADFEQPEGSEMMINTVCKDPHGWFPVENRFSLAPTELQMLQADLAELRKTHDEVFIMMPGGFRRGGSFFEQVLTVCDSVLLLAGAGTTSRADLSYVRRHAKSVGRPVMGIVTGASARMVHREMEEGK